LWCRRRRFAAEALALRVLADRIEHGEASIEEPLSVSFERAAA
jgi:hypothetical protein